jgi:hypothetical protein
VDNIVVRVLVDAAADAPRHHIGDHLRVLAESIT